MESLRWGILGTGGIARRFASSLPKSKTGYLHAVGSRTYQAADKFVGEYGGTPYGSYQGVLDDPNVYAVYISLPHHLHAEWAIKCAKAGKHILCEKPLTLNAHDAGRVIDAAVENGVFLMEAFMYRCHPQTQELRRLVETGAIGEVLLIQSEFGFAAPQNWKNFRTEAAIGGGGLMDVGCYCVSMCRMIAGCEPTRVEYVAQMKDGYDAYGTGILGFPNGITATIGCGIHASLKSAVTIYGSGGRIDVPSPWFVDQPFVVYKNGFSEPEVVRVGPDIDLYANEADLVTDHLDLHEIPFVTWNDSLGNMRVLDRMRESAGLKFQGD